MADIPELAISVMQPWAWLITHRIKDVENRTWSTNVRGPVFIHAPLTFDHEGYLWVRRRFPHILLPILGQYETGGIVGMARIIACVQKHASKWFTGPFGFVLEDARPLPFVPLRGAQKFFTVRLP